MTTLEQKGNLRTLKFEIDDTGLAMRTINRNGESEYHVPFEKITVNKTYAVQDNQVSLVIGILFLIAAIILFFARFNDPSIEASAPFFWLAVSMGGFVYYYRTKVRKLSVLTADNKRIEFFRDKPSNETVGEFINELFKRRNSYLNSIYGQPSSRLGYTPQLDAFNWLLNAKVISKAEYDEKVIALNSLFNVKPGDNRIGFTPNR